MLNLIFGRNGSGKTEYVRNLVADGIKSGNDGYIIIVPEQFSYETEKAMLDMVGTGGMLNVEILSFSRLANIIIENYGMTSDKQPVTDGVRLMSMSLALRNLCDAGQIKVYRKYVNRPVLLQHLITFATELKQCDVSTDELKLFADELKPCSLKTKLSELVVIVNLYNTYISNSFYDNNDSLNILADILNKNSYFDGKTVVVDAFTRFTKQELNVIEKIILQCSQSYFTFCTDETRTVDNSFSIFQNVTAQADVIKRLANKAGVSVAKPLVLTQKTDGILPEISFLEENVYRNSKQAYGEDVVNGITIMSAPNITSECESVALKIKKLMRENSVRCRDILVLERKKDTYDRELIAAFQKYGVPYFEDKRQPVDSQPLIVYIRSLLEIAVNGISTETLMRCLKTGLSPLEDNEIAELENYAILWNINSSEWKNEFVSNPRGYGSEFNDFDKITLRKLNDYRVRAVAPLLAFKCDFSQAVNEKKIEVLYSFISHGNVRERLKTLAKSLSDSGNIALYEEQNTVWSLTMNMLDELYLATVDGGVNEKVIFDLFDILLSATDFGTLPQGLDDVTIGAADRSKTEKKKYAFIVGANTDIFPLCPSTQGLINDNERIKMRENGIELAETAEYKQVEEKFIAYTALTSATDGVFVSYSTADLSGSSLSASSIVSEIKAVFPSLKIENFENTDELYKVESDVSAFEVFAESYGDNTDFSVTLNNYFAGNEKFSGRVSALENSFNKSEIKINDPELALRLFGKDMSVSASKTEVYYKCPFEYFCKYGIKAEPRKEAQIDSALSGSVMHFVFEKMLSEFTKAELQAMTDDNIKTEINRILNNYLNDNMGGTDNKSKRFLQQYNSINERTFSIIKRMIEEFRNSDFTPVDFELSISEDGEIKPYELKLEDSSVLKISGSVDRVDVMDCDGRKYLRVVDYKSNGKDFRLCDVMGGLSTQMLIYLFALDTNGKQKYGEIVPSGVLYMSGKFNLGGKNLGRNATDEEVKKVIDEKNVMSGIVLDDMQVVQGMEKNIEGKYIPVKLKGDVLSGSVIKYDELMKLKDKVDKTLSDMVIGLHNGRVPVLPTKDACRYCDYKAVCGFENGDTIREIPKLKNDEVIEMLNEEGESDNG